MTFNAGRTTLNASLAVMFCCSLGAQAPPAGSGDIDYRGFVRVIEADTFEIWPNGHQTAVGLAGISVPQGNTDCGLEAIAAAQALVAKGAIFQERPGFSFDSRKRRTYFAQTTSGLSVQVELVRQGFALPNGPTNEGPELGAALADARMNKRGCVHSATPGNPHAAVDPAMDFASGTVAVELQQHVDLKAPAPLVRSNPVKRAAVLPAGFSERVIASGLNYPTNFTFLPDGRILIALKSGVVVAYKNGALLATPFIDIRDRVNAYWDHGLLGIVADPNFAVNNYVYLLYTYEDNPVQYNGTKTARLTRVTAFGDTASPFTETVLLGTVTGSSCNNFPSGTDCIPSDGVTHSIGSVRFASDGTLFVTTGDAADYNVANVDALRSQDIDLLAGKVLHITPTGAGVPSNQFWDGNASHNRSKVYAYGLRNPFRMSLRPGTDTVYLGDVGWSTWEEINVVLPGSNAGWPCYEGPVQNQAYSVYSTCQTLYAAGTAAVLQPAITWNHNSASAAAVGGVFYTGATYPPPYQGAYFYGDYAQSFINFASFDTNQKLSSTPLTLATNGTDGPVAINTGPNGDLYYVSINTGELREIVYTAGNSPPAAAASATPTNGLAPLNVQFSSTGTTDPDGDTLTFSWNFGDGSALSTQASPAHTYTVNGLYTATLTVNDGHGNSAMATVHITVGNRAPTATITAPLASLTFKVGDTINYTGSATDPDDGPLPAGSLSWSIVLHHCPGGYCHIHPFWTSTGNAGSFLVPDHGDQYFFEVILTATDSGGLTGVASVNIQPQTSRITVASSPSGLNLVYGGTSGPSPMTFTAVVNSSQTIGAPTPQSVPGTLSTFVSWSDMGAAQHNISIGTTDTTNTAAFNSVFAPVYINAGGSGYLDPGGNAWSSDAAYLNGFTYATSNVITNTDSPTLYQSEHVGSGGPLQYQFNVPNGNYTVTLKYAELYWTQPGERVFSVSINGQIVESAFDVFALAGGANVALDRSYPVTVSSGQINIVFTAISDNPAVNAIRILAGSAPVTVNVSPGSASLTASQTQQFTATVMGSANTAVTWSLTPNVGTISSAGLYTAPATISSTQSVTVKATSVADNTASGIATITLTPPAAINVTVSPTTASLSASQTQQFTATVTGTTNTVVTWSLNPNVGAVSSSGLYTAPASIPATQTVTIKATSAADTTRSGTATITLNPPVGTFSPILVNSGGPAFTDPANQVWSADTGFTGGATSSTTASISNTTTPTLYQTERYGAASYQFTVPAGTYSVTLKFAEIFFSQAGQRVFNIGINGQTVETNLDVFAAAGGKNIALDKTYSVTSTGQITISLLPVVENPKVSAIQIVSGSAPVSVSVSPPTASLSASQTQQFTATVTGTTNTAVTWSLTPNVGTISTSGLYTAPTTISSSQTVTAKATSAADTTKSGTATITLNPPGITVTVSPTTASLSASQTRQFTATVTGTTNTTVTWSLTPNVGTISTSGLYTAPTTISSSQTVTVKATSAADTTKSGTATITLNPSGITVTVSPTTASLSASQTRQFTATVTGTTNTAVTWSLTPNVGTISTSGLYTAPTTISSSQTVTAKATSAADTTKSGTATITLNPPGITVTVSPTTASLSASQTRQFTATVTGTTNTAVTWSLTPNVGTISTSGLYTAPSTISSSQTVTVKATSAADTTKSGTATVTLNPTSTFTPIRVNSAGPAFTDPANQVWSADTGFSGGGTGSTNATITNTTTPTLYQTERYGAVTYQFSAPSGTYNVTLKFAEIFFGQAGKRVFNISINGQTVETNLDVFVAAGGKNIAFDKTYTITSTGQITISLLPVVENPKISAIQIVSGP